MKEWALYKEIVWYIYIYIYICALVGRNINNGFRVFESMALRQRIGADEREINRKLYVGMTVHRWLVNKG